MEAGAGSGLGTPQRFAIATRSSWRGCVSQEALVLVPLLFGPLRRDPTPNADEIEECGESTYKDHEHRQNHLPTFPPTNRRVERDGYRVIRHMARGRSAQRHPAPNGG